MQNAVLRALCVLVLGSAVFPSGPASTQQMIRSHGWAIHGELKYPADFAHFDYVNPKAPKGGAVTLGIGGTFDSVHPFVVSGTTSVYVQGSRSTGGAPASLIFDTLMAQPYDEPSAEYGLIAESLEVTTDAAGVFTEVTFYLREEARFHDGKPIRADDVVWSFNIVRNEGLPQFKFYYGNIAEVEAIDDLTVTFRLTPGDNKEIPAILGQVYVLPKHFWEGRDFKKSTLEPLLGSGPYKIADVNPGKSLTIERVEDYWAADLPVTVGHYNFGTVRYEYYRDPTVLIEALKAGDIDYRFENSARNWATAYDVPAVRDGRILLKEFEHGRVAPMVSMVMNQRRSLFADIRVREAMTYLWDFEWVNRNIMYDAYFRTVSYFGNSELQATGLPGPKELEVLEPLRDQLPPRVFTETYAPPATDGSGNNRDNLRQAVMLLREAGWAVKNGVLTHTETGMPFEFEILLGSELMTPHMQALVRGVERIGGKATIRVADAAQYGARVGEYDFDMTVDGWQQSRSPGNEQREFFGSAAADRPGSRNTPGLTNPAVDVLIEELIAAPDRETLVARVRALDRALLWQFIGIPMYYSKVHRYAVWNRFGFSSETPVQGMFPIHFWWVDPELDAALERAGRG